METQNAFRTYVDHLLSPTKVGIKRILADSDSFIEQGISTSQSLLASTTTQANNAAASASDAASSAQAAATNAASTASDLQSVSTMNTQIIAMLRSFSEVWYGTLSADPTTAPDGTPIKPGAEYYNSTTNEIRLFDGATNTWQNADAEELANAQNSALSASQAAASASTANQYMNSALTYSQNAASSANKAQTIANELDTLLPNLSTNVVQWFLRVASDGTQYELVSPSTVMNELNAASLSSPNFNGTPTAPTAPQDTSTNQLATTAYMCNQASSTIPVADSANGAIGTSLRYARGDHSHVSDPTKVSGTYGTSSSNNDRYCGGVHFSGVTNLPGVWIYPNVTSFSGTPLWYDLALDSQVLHYTGGTMQGAIRMGSASLGSQSIIMDGPNNSSQSILFAQNGTTHWGVAGNADSLTGGNNGNNFVISASNDSGVWMYDCLKIYRNTGVVSALRGFEIASNLDIAAQAGTQTTITIDKPNDQWSWMVWQNAGSNMWQMGVSGSQNNLIGCDFTLQSWNGGYYDTPFSITRSTGVVYAYRGLEIQSTSSNSSNGAINATSSLVQRLTSRNSNYYTSQYMEEEVGDEIRHVINIGGLYAFRFAQDGRVDAGVFNGTALRTDYGDLAEIYTSPESYAPGTAVVISREEEYDISIAPAGSRFIFGVVSTNPGHLLNANATDGVPVALTGRVPALVTGAIYKGDPVSVSTTIEGTLAFSEEMILGFALETNTDPGVKLIEVAIGGRG